MNSTECCKTIGCNCGGTVSAEQLIGLQSNPWIFTVLVLAVVVLTIIIVQYQANHDHKYKEVKNKNGK